MTKRDYLIYVVDDDESVRRGITRLLKASGFNVQTYESALAFLGDAPVTHNACLVLDIDMQGMSGLKLVEHMIDSGVNLPTILITAHELARGQHSRLTSVLGCLMKPFTKKDLLDLIEEGLLRLRRSS